ncbi:MAG TPA: HtaA domain-containing protein [Solirubrobacterales bacterium]|nr:HtaA domain-containing protein [Solirubrobacterales bacterium]
MDRNQLVEARMRIGWLLTLLAVASLSVAASAQAAAGQGTADIRLAQHSKGRTLSGQGVKVIAGAPALKNGNVLSLPISTVETGASAAAGSDGWLRFKRGKRALVLSALRFDLGAGTLNGSLSGEDIAVFRLGTPAQVDPATGKVALSGGNLRLTAEAAGALKQQLGLERALARKGVGVLWLAAQANVVPKPQPPAPPAPSRVAVPVESGQVGWGVLASWRNYVLNVPPAGTITTADGATVNGSLSAPTGFIGFPMASGGSTAFEQGLHGATDRLVLETEGSVKFAKPGHCIVEVKLANLVVTLEGADGSIVLDSVYDIDTPPMCADQPAVPTDDVDFASLDLSGVAPVYSEGGKTVTWSGIPATLTAEGSTAFGLSGQYKPGQALDPVTVTVGLE